MRKFSTLAVFTGIVGLSLLATGCSQWDNLRARMSFREANGLYQGQNWEAAAEKYEETVARNPTDSQLLTSYFFLGNSYDNQYLPSRRGRQANDDLLTKAVENYKKSVEVTIDNPQIRTLSLQYLVAAYGPEKLNDPQQAEPLLQQMIQMDPKEVPNYTLLAQLYEDFGDYERAEATLIQAREARPDEGSVYTTLAAYYDRQGEFDKLVEALQTRTEIEPNNPEAFYTMATYYFNKASTDFSLSVADKEQYAVEGVEIVDKALALNNDYEEALTYKNLFLRLQANMEKSVSRQNILLAEADEFRDRAAEVRRLKASGLVG